MLQVKLAIERNEETFEDWTNLGWAQYSMPTVLAAWKDAGRSFLISFVLAWATYSTYL